MSIDIGPTNQCNSGLFRRPHLESTYEAHLSAFKDAAATSSRLSRAHAYPRRQSCYQRPAKERAGPPERVIVVRATLPWAARLRGAAQFTGAFQKRYRSQHFLLLTRPGGSVHGGARLGIVIGRRQIARAVERSRLRRIIREAFRVRRNQFGDIDVLVKYRGGPSTRGKTSIRSELDELFGQVAP